MKPKKNTKKRFYLKKWQIAFICAFVLVLAISVFLLVWYFGDRYDDFDDFSEEMPIPALDEGFAPQGFGHYGSYYFISGYMNDGSASRVYVIYSSTSDSVTTYTTRGYFTMKYKDDWNLSDNGTDTTFCGHAGGIATDGSTIWIASDGMVYSFKYSETANLRNSKADTIEITFAGKFDPYNGADFAYYYSSTLYVGEFYRSGNYETPETHWFNDGTTQYHALYMTYKTNSGSNVWGIDSAKTDGSGSNIGVYPQTAVAIPDRIQGIAIANSTIVLSQSYGLSPSHLLTYKYSSTASSYLTDSSKTLALTKNDKTVFEVPVSFLTEQVNDYEIPCMSEGLCTNGSKVYVLFESGATKYRTFVRERLTNVYSFTPAKKDS